MTAVAGHAAMTHVAHQETATDGTTTTWYEPVADRAHVQATKRHH